MCQTKFGPYKVTGYNISQNLKFNVKTSNLAKIGPYFESLLPSLHNPIRVHLSQQLHYGVSAWKREYKFHTTKQIYITSLYTCDAKCAKVIYSLSN